MVQANRHARLRSASFRHGTCFTPAGLALVIGLVCWLGILPVSSQEKNSSAERVLVGAAAVALQADDSMVIGGSIFPGRASGQEGELRAIAVVLEKPGQGRLAIVSCDVLMLTRDLLDPVAEQVAREFDIPADRLLIHATHTHHAPSTVTVHGYERDEVFCRRVQEGIRSALAKAVAQRTEAECYFALGQEATVGQNSRLLLSDGTIYWIGPREDAVRPTGPFDPELPVLAFRRQDRWVAVLFNHSNAHHRHTQAGRAFAFFLRSGSTGTRTGAGRHRVFSGRRLRLNAQSERAMSRGGLPYQVGGAGRAA
jgi:hypothetical protein